MLLEIEINPYMSVEIETMLLYPGHGPIGHDTPAEGPEYDYRKAWIVRGNKRREVNPWRIIEALERRYGNDCLSEANRIS
jgi:hypothetical protein